MRSIRRALMSRSSDRLSTGCRMIVAASILVCSGRRDASCSVSLVKGIRLGGTTKAFDALI